VKASTLLTEVLLSLMTRASFTDKCYITNSQRCSTIKLMEIWNNRKRSNNPSFDATAAKQLNMALLAMNF